MSTSALPLKLDNVLHVPKLKYNLLSVQKLCHENNCKVGFDLSSVHIEDKVTGTILIKDTTDGGVYTLSPSKPIYALLAIQAFGDVWHKCLGHCGSRILKSLRHKHFVQTHSKFRNKCVSCKLGKALFTL